MAIPPQIQSETSDGQQITTTIPNAAPMLADGHVNSLASPATEEDEEGDTDQSKCPILRPPWSTDHWGVLYGL